MYKLMDYIIIVLYLEIIMEYNEMQDEYMILLVEF
jgi:hypothetical protein